MLAALRRFFAKDRPSPFYPLLPAVDDNRQSRIPGMCLLDDVAGRPLIKTALNDGYETSMRCIAQRDAGRLTLLLSGK